VNEYAGCVLARHLIADHPQIERHLSRRASREKITVIPYGSDLLETKNDDEILSRFQVASGRLITVIARAEPENSILEIVRAFSRKPRGVKLVVLGRYNADLVRYHAAVIAAASDEVLFAGPVYEKSSVRALRSNSLFYIHGHQVGGCNPSLVEAMGAGNAVIAHDNHFNRWVAQDGALYFADESACEAAIEQLLEDAAQCRALGTLNRLRASAVFNWSDILQSYDNLLAQVAFERASAGESDWGRRPCWQLDVDTS
jgi:glycosyltransferase involved in cell wall biosynthesis